MNAIEQPRLLIVDDEEPQLRALCETLALEGYHTRGHRSAQQALQSLRPGQFELLLTDLMMPEMDGIHFIAAVRQIDPELAAIVMTGHGAIDTAVEAMQGGALDYILKPFKLKVILPVIARALEVRRLRRENALLQESERRRAQELAIAQQVRANEQRLRDTIETSQDWIWELDAQGHFKFCSAAVTQILGYDAAELIGKDFRAYLHEGERGSASLLPASGQAHLTGAVARWRAADGQSRWLERNVVAMFDEAQRTVGFRGTDRDITARRDQEARLQRLTRTYRMLSSTGSAILRLRDRVELLSEVCRIAVQQGGYDRAVISLIDPGTKVLRPRAWAGADSDALRAFDRAVFDPQSDRMLERTLRTGLRMIRNDLAAERGAGSDSTRETKAPSV